MKASPRSKSKCVECQRKKSYGKWPETYMIGSPQEEILTKELPKDKYCFKRRKLDACVFRCTCTGIVWSIISMISMCADQLSCYRTCYRCSFQNVDEDGRPGVTRGSKHQHV